MKKKIYLLLIGVSMFLLTACGGETDSDNDVENGEEAQEEQEGGEQSHLDGIIEDQTFEVELEGWGTVTFASFAPTEAGNDVEFMLMKDGQKLYAFPGWSEENVRIGDEFDQVQAVAFRDFDEDGKDDVITICSYTITDSTSDEDTYNEVRVYRQTGEENTFEIDELIVEFLMTRRYSDSIATIMGAQKEYQEYVSQFVTEADLDAQLLIIAENEKEWMTEPEFANDAYQYLIADLDRNGRYEIILSNMGGTGFYTYTRIFQVNETFDGLVECKNGFMEGDSQPDIMVESTTVYTDEDGNCHYIFGDLMRVSPEEYHESIHDISLQNNQLLDTVLATKVELYGEDDSTVTCTNAAGDEITEEEYNSIADDVFSGAEKETMSLQWNDMEEILDRQPEEIYDILKNHFALQ